MGKPNILQAAQEMKKAAEAMRDAVEVIGQHSVRLDALEATSLAQARQIESLERRYASLMSAFSDCKCAARRAAR